VRPVALSRTFSVSLHMLPEVALLDARFPQKIDRLILKDTLRQDVRGTERPLAACDSGSHADARAAPFAANGPADPSAAYDPGDLTPDLPLQHRPPRDQAEVQRVLDQRELPVADQHRATADRALNGIYRSVGIERTVSVLEAAKAAMRKAGSQEE
jgi:hypothetical protein